MDTTKLVQNLEEYVQSAKSLLQNHELDALQKKLDEARKNISGMREGREDVRTHAGLENFEEQLTVFDKSIQKNDMQRSAKRLILMEEAVQELRQKHTVAAKVGMPDGGAPSE